MARQTGTVGEGDATTTSFVTTIDGGDAFTTNFSTIIDGGDAFSNLDADLPGYGLGRIVSGFRRDVGRPVSRRSDVVP